MESSRRRRPERGGSSEVKLPEIPTEPLEFLARSWSPSALQLSKTLSLSPPPLRSTAVTKGSNVAATTTTSVPDGGGNGGSGGGGGENEESAVAGAAINDDGDPQSTSFSFASSAPSTSLPVLVIERIMSQSEISPLTSGRPSHSSGPLTGISLTEDRDSAVVSPCDEFDDVVKYMRSNNTLQPLFTGGHNSHADSASGVSTPTTKTVGRWLKERKEKRKQEARAHNAHLHAVMSVANVSAAVAAIAAATAAASATGKDDEMAKTDMAVASAATLVAAQCVEAAESMGAERYQLISAISSAVNVRTHDDITTLTAAAATALRGAATLKAKALKDVWSVGVAVPAAEKGTIMRMSGCATGYHDQYSRGKGFTEGLALEDDFMDSCHQQLLARGTELLKRTRKGDLHWKIVSVYIHRTGQVMLKMKSKHVAGTITKKKKNVVLDVCRGVKPWPGRHLIEGGEQRRYFGLKTATCGVVEFECKNQRDHDIWTQGVHRLLCIAAEKNNLHN